MTITKSALREIIADSLRDHRSDAPGDCADVLVDVLKRFAPRAFTDERLDLESEDRYTEIARQLILASSVNIDRWEIEAAFPRLTQDEVTLIDDLIGQSTVTVTF